MLTSCLHRTRTPILALCLMAALCACNGDDDDKGDDNPVGPGAGGAAAVLSPAVFAEMNAAVEKAIGLLFLGGGAVPGAGGGQILVAGTSFTFDKYSPDGAFVLDGQLQMNLLVSPVTVKGNLVYTGNGDGDVIVDMTIDATTDPITYGGTLVVNGQTYQVAELAAANR